MGCHVRILRIHGALAPVECQDQIRRLARVFAIRSTAEVDDNIVVRCGHAAR